MMPRRQPVAFLSLSLAVGGALLGGCTTDQHAEAHNIASPSSTRVATDQATALVRNATEVTGVEGFYAYDQVTDAWLGERRVPITRAVLGGVRARTVKLVLDGGEMEVPEQTAAGWEAMACDRAEAARWNTDRCQGLKARRCSDGTCTLHYFGNCSGVLLGGGQLLTAAHCVGGLLNDEARRTGSSILVPGPDGRPVAQPFGEIRAVLKRDFDHHWVSIDETAPVDVALVTVDDGGLDPLAVAAVPALGAPLFIHGYPRVEGRSEEAMASRGYGRRAGEPSFSFGRLAHPGGEGQVFCNVDGDQEHWRLSEDCPTGAVTAGGEPTWRGPITELAVLGTYDSLNGYSGAPVFDAQGRLVAINSTIMSPFNPQERYGTEMFTVAIAAEPALQRLLAASAP